MKVTAEEFKAMEMVNNRVLLKPVQSTGYIMMGDTKLYVKSGTTEREAIVIYEVVKLPDRLINLPPEFSDSMEWTTDMELRLGDKVWIHRIQAQNAQRIECEGETYLSLPYQYIYLTLRRWVPEKSRCKIFIDPDILPKDRDIASIMRDWERTGILFINRDAPLPRIVNTRLSRVPLPPNVRCRVEPIGNVTRVTYYEVIMLNGYILYENIDEDHSGSVHLIKKPYMRFAARVVFTGSLNKAYRYWKWPDANYIHPGDIVHLKIPHRIVLEDELFAEFLDRKPYYLTQRQHIAGKIKFRDI